MANKDLHSVKMKIMNGKFLAPYLSEWVHKKGGLYVVRMHVIIESTLDHAIVYNRKFDEPEITWCRPATEFFDGRFTRTDDEELNNGDISF